MTLDEQLRETLSEEAELRDAPPLDLVSLISGGRVRRRRRAVERFGIGVLATVLVGGTAYGVTQVGAGKPGTERGTEPGTATHTTEPSQSAPTTSALQNVNRHRVEPGTYRVFVGVDTAGKRIEADMTVDGPGWFSGDDPVVQEGDYAAGVGVYRPQQVADTSACGVWLGRDAAPTPQGLARQLARLPLGTVIQPPTPIEAFGHLGMHLRVRIDLGCPREVYNVVLAALGYRGISYSEAPGDVVIDFWVMDLDGTTVVVDEWHHIDAPQTLVDRATRARDSITFLPTG